MTYYNGSIFEQEWIHCCRNGYFSWSSHLTITTVLQQNHNLIFRPEEMNIVVWSHISWQFHKQFLGPKYQSFLLIFSHDYLLNLFQDGVVHKTVQHWLCQAQKPATPCSFRYLLQRANLRQKACSLFFLSFFLQWRNLLC